MDVDVITNLVGTFSDLVIVALWQPFWICLVVIVFLIISSIQYPLSSSYFAELVSI